jgi:hypothetical protein
MAETVQYAFLMIAALFIERRWEVMRRDSVREGNTSRTACHSRPSFALNRHPNSFTLPHPTFRLEINVEGRILRSQPLKAETDKSTLCSNALCQLGRKGCRIGEETWNLRREMPFLSGFNFQYESKSTYKLIYLRTAYMSAKRALEPRLCTIEHPTSHDTIQQDQLIL